MLPPAGGGGQRLEASHTGGGDWRAAPPPAYRPSANPRSRGGSIVALRDHLRRKARSIGAIFIDPLREVWFAGRAHRHIGPDGIHPTNAAHRYIAARVIADLRRHPVFADLP